ncbi:MAG TPA: SCO family protein, partial [Devosia sp.]|nr:SCO family protein [Devosia sp.]
MQRINEPVPGIGGPFTMQATTGKTFTEKDLVGRPSLLFFGYTFCPDVCPTTLADTTSWRAALGLGADDLNIIFVSVDPERDDMDSLKEYVGAFGSSIIGLRGTKAQTDAI